MIGITEFPLPFPPPFPPPGGARQGSVANSTVTVLARLPEAVESNEAVPLSGSTVAGGDAARESLFSCPAVALILNTAVTVQP